jgi:hypothetical protein
MALLKESKGHGVGGVGRGLHEGGRQGKFYITSVEENPEDDWFGTITQAPSARARTSLGEEGLPPWPMRPLRCSCL